MLSEHNNWRKLSLQARRGLLQPLEEAGDIAIEDHDSVALPLAVNLAGLADSQVLIAVGCLFDVDKIVSPLGLDRLGEDRLFLSLLCHGSSWS